MAHFVENSGWMFEHAVAHDLQSLSADAAPANETVSAAANETVHDALQSLWHQSDLSNGSASSAHLDPVLATSVDALLHPLAGAGNGNSMPIAPVLTIANNALTVTEGGSVALPISVSATPANDASVTIKGLTGYETVTDGLDHKVFSGSSITVTAAEVNGGLCLSSSYSGPGHPVNTLTVAASETLGGHIATSASQTIIVTDPPAPTPSATTGASGNPLTLVVTGDNMHGTDPQVEVFVDGTQIGGTYTVTADHSQGQTQTIQLAGNFDPGVTHQVQVKFINDAWDGQMGDGHDVNVYVESISLNGKTIAGIQGTNTATNGGVQASNANEAVMDVNGSLSFNVPAAPPAPSVSSSGNPLTLVVTGDNMHGTDPQVEVFVDGTQIGGTYTITADHGQGQAQTIAVAGNFDPSVAHQVQVKFVNDAWDGTSTADGHDVNVYVESISLNGSTIAGIQGTNTATNGAVQASNANEAVMDINGSLSFNVPAGSPAPSGGSGSGSSGGVTGSSGAAGSGTSSSGNPLTLVVTGDNMHGTDPQIEVFVDGTQIGGTYTITADHGQGQTQTIAVAGNFDPSVAHQVQVKFINDAWDGQAGDGHDVNVYVESISLNGKTIAGVQGTNTATNGGVQAANADEAVMDINGSLSFNVPADPPAPSGSGGSSSSGGSVTGSTGAAGSGTSSSGNPLTLVVTGDNMHGTDPQIEVFVDGTQIGGTYTITADHGQGQTQTIAVAGNFDPAVAHQVQVKFINDAWDGQAGDGHDVNVYLESISLNGKTIAGIQGTNTATNGAVQAANANEAVMDINGSLTFNVPSDPPATSGSSSGSSSSGSSSSGSGTTGGGTSTGDTSGILPEKIDGEWWWPFNPPTIATVQSQAPQINYLSLVGAFTAGGGGGSVNDGALLNDYSSVSALQADIAAWKASGRVVVGMIGGGGDSTVIANATDVAQFMATAVPIIKQLGLQGVDFDLENTPDAASVASLITQLKAEFGPDFIISLSPRPFELRPGGVYRAVIQDAGINNIDLVQPQDYALNGDSLSAQESYMNSDMSDWINGTTGLTIPANKLLIGSFDPGEGESLSTSIQTFQHYKGVYPTLRGGMFWETREDANQLNWQFSSQLAQAEQ